MSEQHNDGGPAFPRTSSPATFDNGAQGMSLRDWFAGQALPWCLAEFGGNAEDQTQPVEAAYQIADAMLVARANREAKP